LNDIIGSDSILLWEVVLMTLDEFFTGRPVSQRLFDTVAKAVTSIGPAEIRVSKSQIAFRRRTGFAFVWMPGMYLGCDDVPLVLTIGLYRRDDSPRWKQVVEPAPGRFTHHLELHSGTDIDSEVYAWLQEAWHDAA
jgi:hypothetical protein